MQENFKISFSFASTSYLYRRQFSQELLKRIYMHLWSHMAKLSRFHSENFWNNEIPFYVDKRMHFIWLSLDWQKKNQMCLLKIKSMNCRANGYNHHCETIFNSTCTYKLIKMNRCMHFYIMTLKILITGTLIRFQASFLSQNVYD